MSLSEATLVQLDALPWIDRPVLRASIVERIALERSADPAQSSAHRRSRHGAIAASEAAARSSSGTGR
jgi:hypothetical protein